MYEEFKHESEIYKATCYRLTTTKRNAQAHITLLDKCNSILYEYLSDSDIDAAITYELL